ncbi:hypothetical protein J2744_002554 [Halorubrum trapanicum]|uniref:Uncharacterized protein n=1 Tax=Halorubrum trapanicum TaxID=29284 RepID=A0A8J7R9Q8_9EURY|nr:hypothetical protein [Halorubrum trapanicum]MBP1902852.1 hypothetical protein [Halorubrum trapanicum]
MLEYVIQWLRRYATVLLLAVGLLLLYVFVSLEFWSIVGPILGVAIGGFLGVVGLLLKRFYLPSNLSIDSENDPLDARIPIILACLYAAAIIVLFRFHTYQRPPLLYVLFGGYAGLIAYQIARGAPPRSIVPQIASLSFFTYWSSQLLFPAGMAGPDTLQGYIPGVEYILSTGNILSGQTIYAGHLAHTAAFSQITGLSPQLGYFLLATLLLVCTVLVISILDHVFPSITRRMALYATLIFATSSWMLGRGMHPNKLNFFYALILLLGSTGVLLYRSLELPNPARRRVLLGITIMPALIFGHQFSAGAAMILLIVLGVFAFVSSLITPREYAPMTSAKGALLFVSVYLLGVMGNPIHQDPLVGRFTGLLLSVVQSSETGTATGGPGRYSELAIDVLIASTAAQTILFVLSILGAVWLFRRSEWEYDFVLTWIGAISLLLVVSLLTNSVDTAPQRFYGLLILFGFNICVGTLFYVIDRRGRISNGHITISGGRITVVFLVISLSVAGLASPVADKATSPVGDDLPHFRQFNTHQEIQGDKWTQTYVDGSLQLTHPGTSIPIEQTGPNTGEANLTGVDRGTLISYSDLTNRTGVISESGLSLGGRQFVFVESPEQPTDSRVYENGETRVFVHR